ncbi:uncharacterized protein C8R40DRAFT_781439 [Lentinula edodes]|uniref:uncharacterized protein n=1 Tax=Lentinula edodes TaxID=5353 RepID=UPI001E8EAEE2|nr:uncharacterized protein C8R40DRAFT_781439 [Lentinula edodes]KAH7878672.1 hypothetical protein C8R40DRAFT_781439 [Lentinula edodes]
MTISLSPADTNDTAYPNDNIHALYHGSLLHHQQCLSGDLAQQCEEENHLSPASIQPQNDNAHSIGTPHRNSTGGNEIPPRPASRLDFVLGSSSTQLANAQDEVETQAQVRSHKRTPSATFRWTREILKKMRLTDATSTSDFEPPPCPEISATIEPSKAATFLYNGSFADDEGMSITIDIASSPELDSSASNSSLLSSSSSGSYPALESITISLSSSSDFDGSLEDSDTDSDSDSLKEIDLGDGLTGEGNECVAPVKEEQTYVHTYSPIPVSPSMVQAPCTPYPANPHTESILESFGDGDLDQNMLEYTPEPRPKYTCLPSPLSLFPPVIPSPFSQSQSTLQYPSQSPFQPQRHLYTDRGHSRHALHYRKWFWALREEDWARYTEWLGEYQSQQEAYSGMSTSPVLTTQSSEQDKTCTPAVQGWQPEPECSPVLQGWQPELKEQDRFKLFPSLFSSSRDSGPNNSRQQQTETSGSILEDFARSSLPPLTIHPRWGDIVRLNFATTYSSAVACTETWCMHTDRYLLVGMGLGLWTIRKVLWLSELNRICAIPRPREEEEEEEAEGEKTFVVDDESKDPISGSCAENCSISDDNDSLSEEDEDSEEGEVMYSSVVSLASLISTTTSSEDSDVTLVESDSDSEAPLNASSMSDFVAQAEPPLSGRSVDFDKTCSSSGILADEDEEEDFEEVDLGLGCGSSDAACSSSLSGSSNTSVDIFCPERESLALLRTLYFDSHAVSSSMVTKDYAMSNAQGKCKLNTQHPQLEIASLAKRSWYEQCELLLQLTGARETRV